MHSLKLIIGTCILEKGEEIIFEKILNNSEVKKLIWVCKMYFSKMIKLLCLILVQ